MNKTKILLKKHIKENGISITKLARCMDVTYTQLYKYLDENSNPTLSTLNKLADGLTDLTGERHSILDLLEINGECYRLEE